MPRGTPRARCNVLPHPRLHHPAPYCNPRVNPARPVRTPTPLRTSHVSQQTVSAASYIRCMPNTMIHRNHSARKCGHYDLQLRHKLHEICENIASPHVLGLSGCSTLPKLATQTRGASPSRTPIGTTPSHTPSDSACSSRKERQQLRP